MVREHFKTCFVGGDYDRRKEITEKDEYMTNFEIEDENDMARFFESYGLDEISKYETGNSFYETEVTDTNIYECEVIQ